MVGRTIISLIATSDGCSIANPMARAMLAGSIPILVSSMADFNSGSEIVSSNSVVIVPGEIIVVRILLLASSIRRPSVIARTANFVPQ